MITVFTPTIRHEGIKIVANCLKRQTFQNFRWVVVDHDYSQKWYRDNFDSYWDDRMIYVPPKVQIPERKYKLWNTRNTGYLFIPKDTILVVEIQDYHWFGDDSLDIFADIFNSFNTSLVSAYYKIVDFKGYDKALDGFIDDNDVNIIDRTIRERYFISGSNTVECNPPFLGYEMNLSSIPYAVLRECVPVDENMDNGYLADTHYIAMQAESMGCPILVSNRFKCYSFEHKLVDPYSDHKSGEMTEVIKRPENHEEDAKRNIDFLSWKFGNRLMIYRANKEIRGIR